MTDVLLSGFLFLPLIIILSSWLVKPTKDLLDIRIFLAFVYFLGGIARPLYLINTGDYIPTRYFLDDMGWFFAIGTCVIALVFLVIGFKSSRHLSVTSIKWVFDSGNFDRRIIWLCIGTFALAGSYGAYLKLVHSQNFIFSDVAFQSKPGTASSGYLNLLRSLLYVAVGLVYWDILQFPRKNKYMRLVILVVLVLVAITQPVMVGARGQLLNILFMLLVPFHYLIKRVTVSKALILGAFITTMVVFLGATRGSGVDVSTVNLTNSQYSDFLFRSHRFFDLVTIGKVVEKVPEKVDYLYGSSLARLFVVPVPRDMWPGKPISLGQVVGAKIYGVGAGVIGGGVPPTIVGELYFNFGVAGVVAGMFLFGVVVRFVHNLVDDTTKTPARVIMYAFSLMGVAGIFVGAFTLAFLNAMMKIIPFYVVLRIASLKNKNVRDHRRVLEGEAL